MRTGSLLVAVVVAGACSGGGKQSADSGAPDASAGTVTFHLVLPSTETFCDEFTCATGFAQHLRISTSGGQPLVLQQSGNCTASCSSANVCSYQCLNEVCIVSHGYAVTTMDSWDGRYQGPSACGASCLLPTYAPPGQYLAQFCATPGTLTMPDGGEPLCTATGAEVCGPTVPFTFPSATPVELPLRATDAG